MKKIFTFTLVIIALSISAQTILEVHHGQQPYPTIQSAIDEALTGNYTGDFVEIRVFDFNEPYSENIIIDLDTYNNLNYDELRIISVNGYENCTIEASEDEDPTISIKGDEETGISTQVIISGFHIIGATGWENSGIRLEDAFYDDPVIVYNCKIEGNGDGISCNHSNIHVNDCIIRENDYFGIFFSNSGLNYYDEIKGTEFSNNGCGIAGFCSTTGYDAEIINCTIAENDAGIDIDTPHYIVNCIVDPGSIDEGTATVSYSNIRWSNPGYVTTGPGNINEDPQFCMETNYEFNLLEGSPCIDTGDPTQTDLDGTRVDMGCYPTIVDIKYCEGNYWNWVSFPRLDREDDEADEATVFLEYFLDWPFDLELLYDNDDPPVLDYTALTQTWYPTSYDVYSSYGYKLDPQDNGDHYLPSQNGATRLPADWELRYTLPLDTDNWMGYWLPWTQNIEDAFGEFWDIVNSVEAEDWYYEYSEQETPTSSPTDKNMVYGKAYIVVFREDIEEFYWTDDMEETEQRERMEAEYFSYNDLPSYEVIDVMDIPQNVLEIGVFEDDLCVGAVVVQDTCEQILVYSTSAIPFSFEIVTNNREAGTPIISYQVLNKETGIYESRSLISGQQKSSVIMFGNLEEPQNEIPVIDNVVLHGNNPNPFNPETRLTFSLPQEQEIELTVYNLKGQKVRTLYTGITSSGEQSVVWNGKDDNGKPVGSGLYFYKLKTKDNVLTKKMLLLK